VLEVRHLAQVSRRDTSHAKTAHLAQLPLGADLGRRGWVHRNLTLRVVESRRDILLCSDIVLNRHYLRRRGVPPRVLTLNYLASLGGEGAAAMAMAAMLPTNLGSLLPALGLHQAEVLQLVRCWRADDLGPSVAPDLSETSDVTVKIRLWMATPASDASVSAFIVNGYRPSAARAVARPALTMRLVCGLVCGLVSGLVSGLG